MMRRGQKEKIYGYALKAVLSLILLFCLYNAVCIIFLSRYSAGKLRLRVSSTVNAVESVIKHAGPKETEVEIVQYEEIEVAHNTEIIFKGMVDGLAYIYVRKEKDGQWREHGFPTKIGEKIGRKKIIGGKMVDLTTNYVLQDIVYNVQRPVTLNKKIVVLNEAGGFDGTRIVPGETYMKSTSKIKYKDKNGNINELWLMESESTLSANRDETVEKEQWP